MVGIYAKIGNGEWIRALEIPLEDIRRFTYRPLKWLRFVAFAILGTEGHLHYNDSGDDGTMVEYETVTGLAEDYYFFPEGDFCPVDPEALNERISLSTPSSRLVTFHRDIDQRDGRQCVVTGEPDYECAHIIPHSKGDLYIQYIISQRRSLYNMEDLDVTDFGIDSPENGVSLNPSLHRRFGKAKSAFLMTPNFALDPGDIPIVERGEELPRAEGGEIPLSRTTFQHITAPLGLYIPPQVDVIPNWLAENTNAPLRLLLDYAYGVAVIKRWASGDVQDLLNSHHENSYKEQMKRKKSSHPAPSHKESDNAESDSDQTTGNTRYFLRSRRARTDHTSKPKDSEMCQAMDTAFQFALLFRGPYKPGTTFDTILRQQQEEAEQRQQQISREKVHEWLRTNEAD